MQNMEWVVPYSNIVEASLVGFLLSGAFLGLADFDLYFQVVAILILLKIIFRKEVFALSRQVETEHLAMPEAAHVLVP